MKKSKTIVKRKKMGRPVTVENGTFVGIRLPADLLRRIDVYAAQHKLDRSAAMRALLDRALDD